MYLRNDNLITNEQIYNKCNVILKYKIFVEIVIFSMFLATSQTLVVKKIQLNYRKPKTVLISIHVSLLTCRHLH